MINYKELINHLVEVAQRHPNISFVEFGTIDDEINDPDFTTPAFIITPITCNLNDNSFVNYGFHISYIDKIDDYENNQETIYESSLQFLLGYLAVLDLDLEYKINKPISFEPIMSGLDGSTVCGFQGDISIENQYNISKYKSYFYE